MSANNRGCLTEECRNGSGCGADWGEVLIVGNRDDAVSAHGCGDTGDICDSVLAVETGDFLVILGAHDARGLKAEDAGRGVVAILIEVRNAAWDVENNAFADWVGFVSEGPGHVTVDTEDGFVVFAVNMRNSDVDEGRDSEFEEVEDTASFVASLEEGDAHCAASNRFVHFVPSCGQDDDTGVRRGVNGYFGGSIVSDRGQRAC